MLFNRLKLLSVWLIKFVSSSGVDHPQIQLRRRKERIPSSIHFRWSPRQRVWNWRPPLPLGRQEQPWFWTHPQWHASASRNAHHPQKQEIQELGWSSPASRRSLRACFLLPGKTPNYIRKIFFQFIFLLSSAVFFYYIHLMNSYTYIKTTRFIQVVEFDAKLLTPIVKNLSAIENYNTSMQLPHTFSLSSILSGLDTERFYTYKGSLTTPPCAEAVTWVVFSDYLPISVFQVRKLIYPTNKQKVDPFFFYRYIKLE